MITDRRTVEYIRLLEEGNGGFLDALEEEAVRDHVPVIRKETQAFLGTMIELVRPERILEVGSAIGFSAYHHHRKL